MLTSASPKTATSERIGQRVGANLATAVVPVMESDAPPGRVTPRGIGDHRLVDGDLVGGAVGMFDRRVDRQHVVRF